MERRIIKTESDCNAALGAIERLVDLDPDPGTPEADELELLTLLVQDYEHGRFPMQIPDPIEAIQFRMEQQDLTQRDLVPYIGSRSKVSEVLSRKRPLTLSMIRALHSGLGIPARVLLQETPANLPRQNDIEWTRFPIREMISRGWIAATMRDAHDKAEELMKEFLAPLGASSALVAIRLRKGHVRSTRGMDKYALAAWTARILIRALEKPCAIEYERGLVDLDFMREVAHLSLLDRGPLLAQELLWKHGIQLIVEPHLAHTQLDGAAITADLGRPVIGLTLRYDRLDNFWFVLMHELAHVARHLLLERESFFDDLDTPCGEDRQEQDADALADKALIPETEWSTSPAKVLRSPEAAKYLADRLGIHPAIVAGRMRYEARNFRILNQLIGLGQVRPLFPNAKWSNRRR